MNAKAQLKTRVRINELILSAACLKRKYHLTKYEAGITSAWLAGTNTKQLGETVASMDRAGKDKSK